MSILELLKRIKPPGDIIRHKWRAPQDDGETISFDEKGNIIRHSLLDKLFLSFFIILLTSLSYGIGRLSVIGDREPVKIEYDHSLISNQTSDSNVQTSQTASTIKAVSSREVVVSKNGSKYHYPHCSGAKRIKEENKIVFNSSNAAEAAGYTLAANCSPR